MTHWTRLLSAVPQLIGTDDVRIVRRHEPVDRLDAPRNRFLFSLSG